MTKFELNMTEAQLDYIQEAQYNPFLKDLHCSIFEGNWKYWGILIHKANQLRFCKKTS